MREANRLQRLHNKTRTHDSVLGEQISRVYQKRKHLLQDAIKRKELQNKMKLFANNSISSKNKSKTFWNMLRGSREVNNPSQIVDPADKSTLVEDKEEIKKLS